MHKRNFPTNVERKRPLRAQKRWHDREFEAEDPEDFQTYAYEYESQTYLRSPPSSGAFEAPTREQQAYSVSPRRHKRVEPPSRNRNDDTHVAHEVTSPVRTHYHSPQPERRRYDTRRENNRREGIRRESYYAPVQKRPAVPSLLSHLHPQDVVYLNQAATKIQAVFRGYSCRKRFWKEMEHRRRQQNYYNASRYSNHEELILPSVTSIVENSSTGHALPTNTDPNVGLTMSLPVLDSSQKNHILRDLRGKINFSDEISTTNQLQSESSPAIILLGGLNPTLSRDYLLGGSIFLYNVQKDRWTFGGTLPEPRNYHGASYLNGHIYITGGYSPLQTMNGQMLATQNTFQLTVRSKRWRRRSDMHQARACHGSCVINDSILVMGGRDASGKLLSTVEFYNPVRDQWSLSKPMPEPLMGMGCTVLDDVVWVIGGIGSSDGHSTRYAVSSYVYIYDYKQQNWFRKPSLPEPRAFCVAATLKREVWVWCGVKDALNEDGYLVSSNSVFVCNSDTQKWEQHHSIGTPKHAMAVAKVGRRVYLLGGVTNSSGSKEVLNENDFYDRENDKFLEGAPLPRPLTGAAAVTLPIDYMANSETKWRSNSMQQEALDEAATRIQAVYRGYRTRSLISNNKYPLQMSNSEVIRKSYRTGYTYGQESVADQYDDKWKLFAPVTIADWPPVPDLRSSSSHLNVILGAQPPGYTITEVSSGSRVRRYVPLPSHADPNLALCGHLCNVYKKAKKVLGLRKVEHLPQFAKNMRTVTNLQDDSVPVVLVMGGLQPRDPVNFSYGKVVMRYHPLKDRWEYFGSLPEPRNYHAAVYYQEFIYITGGCDPDIRNSGEMVATNKTYCLNIHSNEWIRKAEMQCCRSHHGLVAAQDKLFAIGGRDHNGRLVASIEVYEIDSDKWTLLRPMMSPRMGMACAIMDDHIWCMGGIGIGEGPDVESFPVLSSVISYDIYKDVWITRPPLRNPRVYSSCVVVDKTMWLCGGASKDRATPYLISMGSIDKYYPTEAHWVRKTIVNSPRHCAAVVAVDSCIYMFGGISSQEWSALSKNEMVVVNDISIHGCHDLPVPLTGLAAVTIPPVVPSLRSASLALLLHTKLTTQ